MEYVESLGTLGPHIRRIIYTYIDGAIGGRRLHVSAGRARPSDLLSVARNAPHAEAP